MKVTLGVLAVILIAAVAGVAVYALQLGADIRDAEARSVELRAENRELTQENVRLAADIAGLEREVRELVEKLRSLRGERGLLLRDLAELRAELEESIATEPLVVECGDVVDIGAGAYDVTAQNVDCSTALTVARLWQERCFFRQCDETKPINGYLCHFENIGSEVVAVTCNDPSGRLVRFEAGS